VEVHSTHFTLYFAEKKKNKKKKTSLTPNISAILQLCLQSFKVSILHALPEEAPPMRFAL
jgi:hypothetical protein